MDAIDHAILAQLKENGRATASEISKNVHLSIPAIAERIRKLEQAEIIKKYTVRINRENTEDKLLAFIFVNIDKSEDIEKFRANIVKHNSVLECHHVAGSYDYILKVVVKDTQALENFLSDELKKIKGVNSSNTVIALKTLKEEINV